MSFINQKNKLKHLVENSQTNQENIDKQQIKHTDYREYVKSFNAKSLRTKKILTLSTEWEVMSREVHYDEEDLTYQFMNWSVELGTFDMRLLPFIDVNMIYRNADGSWTDNIETTPAQNFFYHLENIEDEEFLKNVTLKSNLHIFNANIESEYQAKLIITFINPRQYI